MHKWIAGALLLLPLAAQAVLTFPGHIEPYRLETLVSPVDGTLAKISSKFSQIVEAGDVLAFIESPALAAAIDDLQQESLLLSERKVTLENWETSQEMLIATQQYQQATMHAKRTCLRAEKSQPLYEAGIISQDEYDSDQQQCDTQQMTLDIATRHYQVTAGKSDPAHMRQLLAQETRLQNREKQLSTQLAASTLVAHQPGQLWAPEKDSRWHINAPAKAGQPLVDIVSTQQVLVHLQADEYDVLNIHIGDRACVQLNTQPETSVEGEVVFIGVDGQHDGHPLAMYPVEVLLPAPSLQQWRFGMGTMVHIEPST
jgi:multidrug resistance efflux pump